MSEERMVTRSMTRAKRDASLTNPVILSQIWSYLPLSDLKNARLVSTFWNQETKVQFLRRTKVKFHVDPRNQVEPDAAGLKFEAYLSDVVKYNYVHQNYELFSKSNNRYEDRCQEFRQRVTRLLSFVGGNVRSLSFTWDSETVGDQAVWTLPIPAIQLDLTNNPDTV